MTIEGIALACTPSDVAYVRTEMATLEELATDRSISVTTLRSWAGTLLPRATYAFADGQLWYARDWWRLYDDAGSIDLVRDCFAARYRACAGDTGLDDEWDAYIAGLYGACLRDVTPETIVAKACLVERLEHALAAACPNEASWCRQLRADVEALDVIAKPFAACDRERFGRATSRERLIDVPRRLFPHVFE